MVVGSLGNEEMVFLSPTMSDMFSVSSAEIFFDVL